MSRMRIIRLEAGDHQGAVRFLSDRVQLAEGKRTIVATVTRTGRFSDPRYGEFEITREMLLSMVRNFEANVYGQKIAVDVAHRPDNGAAGFFRKLFLEGGKLRGEIELTDYGLEAIGQRGYQYLSAEYHENFIDNEQQAPHGATLLGAGLTVRPVIKRLDPIQLSEDALDKTPTLLSERLQRILTEELTMTLKELLDKLRKQLAELKLPEAILKQLTEAFETAAKPLGEEKLQLALMEQFAATGKQLAEQVAGRDPQTIMLDFSGLQTALAAGAGGLSAEAVTKLLDERERKRVEDARQLDERRTQNVRVFTERVEAAESLKVLSETTRQALLKAADLVNAAMSEDQVRALADHQIALGSQMAVQAQLAGIGYAGPQGNVHITLDESNNVKALQESVDKRLGLADMSETRRFQATGGRLQEANRMLAEKVLADFDRRHGAQLHAEHKMLAGGDGRVSDVAVPAIFERTVIREALYQMLGLQFVDVGTLPFASSALIPYSYRDTGAAGRKDTRRYEGQAIQRAGVIQTSDTAYPVPQKIAFEVSDELRYLTASGILTWDAVIENQRNATRIVGEDTDGMIFNEVLQATDEFGALPVVGEALIGVNGVNKIFVLVNFPVVRPRKLFDLQGNQIGVTVNPITVTYAAVVRAEYDGSNTQPAGTYYVLDYNLGEIYFVSELGVLITPPNLTAITISYSRSTNVYSFDTDLGADALDAHWDKFLYRYGLRKSVIEDDRYHMANFGLMRGAVMTQIEQAKQFGANSKRPGTDLAADGNLGRIKDVPNFKTASPGLWMADQRIVLGERGVTRFRMMKPWAMGELENQKDAAGRFTGKKEAYGDQFIVLHTPTPLKRAYTSLTLYSASARINRAA